MNRLPIIKYFRLAIAYTLLCLLVVATAKAQPGQLSIPFGKNNKIVFDLTAGTYTVHFGGKVYFNNAYATAGGTETIDSRAIHRWTYSVTTAGIGSGKRKLYILTCDNKTMQLMFHVFPDKTYFVAELRVKGACNYMSPLTTDQVQLHEKGDNRALFVPFDNDMWVRYDAKPVSKANFTGSEVIAVYNNDRYEGLVMGSLEHTTWKSGIRFKGNDNNQDGSVALYAGFTSTAITHDSLPHGTVQPVNGYCRSPRMLIGLFSDWRDGMEQYAAMNVQAEPRVINTWKKGVPMGWNSWGALQTKLNADNAGKIIDYFYDSCKAFRTSDKTLYIDLDSYWDNMTSGGIDGETSQLADFVKHCKAKGFKPGIYWAPFVDWGKYARKVEGTDVDYTATWVRQNGKVVDVDGGRAMDPTHPATRKRLVHYFERFKHLGFEMVKIDFLVHGAFEADSFFDTKVTTGMQAFSSGMQLLDSVVNGKMLLYAAISPNIATARYVHMRRIACDAFSAIDNTEYTLNSTGYGWWQGKIYDFIDGDHVVFGHESPGSNRARLASALVTGTLITGDDYASYGHWKQAAAILLQNQYLLQLAHSGKAFRPVLADTGNKGVNVLVQQSGGYRYLAVFNFSNQDTVFSIPANKTGIVSGTAALELFSGKTSVLNGSVKVPATDVLILRTK